MRIDRDDGNTYGIYNHESIRAYVRIDSVMHELRRVAKIFGYTQEDIERWEDTEYKEHCKE